MASALVIVEKKIFLKIVNEPDGVLHTPLTIDLLRYEAGPTGEKIGDIDEMPLKALYYTASEGIIVPLSTLDNNLKRRCRLNIKLKDSQGFQYVNRTPMMLKCDGTIDMDAPPPRRTFHLISDHTLRIKTGDDDPVATFDETTYFG